MMMKFLFLCSAIFTIAAFLSPGLRADGTRLEGADKTAALELLNQATRFFNEASSGSLSPEEAASLYRKAALRYERLINEYGITNGKIYYNLGNAYFIMSDIGRALLNYLRAEQYLPDDRNLKQKLIDARASRFDKMEEKQVRKTFSPLFFWHNNLSVETRVMLFSLFFALVWAAAALRIFFKKPFLSLYMAASVFASVLMAGSLVVNELTLKKNRTGVVVSPKTTARSGNSTTHAPAFPDPVHAGTEFALLEDRGDWFYVELADSRTCWISSRDAALVR